MIELKGGLSMKICKALILGGFFSLLTGCESVAHLIETGIENMKIEQSLLLCQLDKEIFSEVICKDQTYTISSEVVSLSDVGDPVAKVNVSITINEDQEILDSEQLRKFQWIPQDEKRVYLSFGWIHEIKEMYSMTKIAININENYYIAELN